MHGDVDGSHDDFKSERPKNIRLTMATTTTTTSPPVLWGPRRKTGLVHSRNDIFYARLERYSLNYARFTHPLPPQPQQRQRQQPAVVALIVATSDTTTKTASPTVLPPVAAAAAAAAASATSSSGSHNRLFVPHRHALHTLDPNNNAGIQYLTAKLATLDTLAAAAQLQYATVPRLRRKRSRVDDAGTTAAGAASGAATHTPCGYCAASCPVVAVSTTQQHPQHHHSGALGASVSPCLTGNNGSRAGGNTGADIGPPATAATAIGGGGEPASPPEKQRKRRIGVFGGVAVAPTLSGQAANTSGSSVAGALKQWWRDVGGALCQQPQQQSGGCAENVAATAPRRRSTGSSDEQAAARLDGCYSNDIDSGKKQHHSSSSFLLNSKRLIIPYRASDSSPAKSPTRLVSASNYLGTNSSVRREQRRLRHKCAGATLTVRVIGCACSCACACSGCGDSAKRAATVRCSSACSGVAAGGRRCKAAATVHMGHGLSMCKIHRCHKFSKCLHLRNSEDATSTTRMSSGGGGEHQQHHHSHGGLPSGAASDVGRRVPPHHHQHHYQHTRPCFDGECARMEAWLDEHPDFVQDYFLRKATRQVVDKWLVTHSTPTGMCAGVTVDLGSPTLLHPHLGAANAAGSSSRSTSGATTPSVRKISNHEFSDLSSPIVATAHNGTPTFLTGSVDGVQSTSGVADHDDDLRHDGGGGSGISRRDTAVDIGGDVSDGRLRPRGGGGAAASGSEGGGGSIGSGSGILDISAVISAAASASTPGRKQRRSRHELRQLEEKEMIFELVKDICNELDIRSLCHKILQNVSILLKADRCSLFLVQGVNSAPCVATNGATLSSTTGGTTVPPTISNGIAVNGAAAVTTPTGKYLVSKLFDVCSRSTPLDMEKREEIRIPWGTGIVGYVAESGESVNIPDAYEDQRFNNYIDRMTGYKTRALLCMPVKDISGEVIGVAQVINKVGDEPFTQQDEQIFSSYLQFCGIGLRNANLYEKSQLEIKRNQVLLDLARMIFEEQSTIEHVVFRILTHTQSLIQCQRVQVLLVHQASKGSFSRVFDFEASDLAVDDGESRTSPYESRFPINIGITGHVATTGETVNILCAYDDDRFDRSVDDGSAFKHKSILCMAIRNSSAQIIGVIQLINKFDESPFSKNDENFVEAFAIFCGMGIHNTHMYERAVVAIAKQSVTLEVLSYHATASLEDAQRVRAMRVPSAATIHLNEFIFDDFHMSDDETITSCIRMFMDLDLVERFHIDYDVLCRWLLSVKKNYRNVTYHNWRHAFNVAQMMFSIITATGWWNVFGEIECLALIIGCLCHDLDHRGTNNSFQIKASSPLAQLYSTSTMEHHHFDQCIMILNSPGNQLLANISSDEYSRIIKYLEEAILSTDLAVYFRKRNTFFQLVREGANFETDDNRELLRAMLMTVCDLAAITKPWEVEKRVAELVSSEFFEQGDMEREELNITPIDIMNREKEDQLPLMQVGFIDSICMPIYESFAEMSESLAPLVVGVKDNRKQWMDIAAEQSLLPAPDNAEPAADNVSKKAATSDDESTPDGADETNDQSGDGDMSTSKGAADDDADNGDTGAAAADEDADSGE